MPLTLRFSDDEARDLAEMLSMAAAVAAAIGYKRLLFGHARGLRKAGQSVKFAQNADNGLSAAERSAESGVDAAELFGNGKAVLTQHLAVKLGGLELLERELRVVPNFISYAFVELCHRVNGLYGCFFYVIHFNYNTFERKSRRRSL